MEESVKSRVRTLILDQIGVYKLFNELGSAAALDREHPKTYEKALEDMRVIDALKQEGVTLERNIARALINLVHITTITPPKEEHVKEYVKAMKNLSKRNYIDNVLHGL